MRLNTREKNTLHLLDMYFQNKDLTVDNVLQGADIDIGSMVATESKKYKLNVNTYLYFKEYMNNFGIKDAETLQNIWLGIIEYSNK